MCTMTVILTSSFSPYTNVVARTPLPKVSVEVVAADTQWRAIKSMAVLCGLKIWSLFPLTLPELRSRYLRENQVHDT